MRILEKRSFPAGTAEFDSDFIPVLAQLRGVLTDVDGTIVVAGHTDDHPISTHPYRFNWDLSAARAVSVVHELLRDGSMNPARFVVEGHADAHPIVPDDSPENRALNRRVEITIQTRSATVQTLEEPLEVSGSEGVADMEAVNEFRTEFERSSGTAERDAPDELIGAGPSETPPGDPSS